MAYMTNEVGEEQWCDFVATLNVPGAGAAAPDAVVIPGLSPITTWGFDGLNTPETLTGTFEMLHDYQEGTDIYPHIHWSKTTGDAGDVRWVLAYSIGTHGQEFGPLVEVPLVTGASGLGPNGRPLLANVEFPAAIPGADLRIGSQIRFQIRREPGNATDTYGADALLWDVGIHYRSDTRGSRQRFTK